MHNKILLIISLGLIQAFGSVDAAEIQSVRGSKRAGFTIKSPDAQRRRIGGEVSPLVLPNVALPEDSKQQDLVLPGLQVVHMQEDGKLRKLTEPEREKVMARLSEIVGINELLRPFNGQQYVDEYRRNLNLLKPEVRQMILVTGVDTPYRMSLLRVAPVVSVAGDFVKEFNRRLMFSQIMAGDREMFKQMVVNLQKESADLGLKQTKTDCDQQRIAKITQELGDLKQKILNLKTYQWRVVGEADQKQNVMLWGCSSDQYVQILIDYSKK
jgi:hypothetical protein